MICHTVSYSEDSGVFGFVLARLQPVLPSMGALLGWIHVLPEVVSEAIELHLR